MALRSLSLVRNYEPAGNQNENAAYRPEGDNGPTRESGLGKVRVIAWRRGLDRRLRGWRGNWGSRFYGLFWGLPCFQVYQDEGLPIAAKGAGIGAGIYSSPKEAFSTLRSIMEIAPAADRAPVVEAYGRWKEILEKQIKD